MAEQATQRTPWWRRWWVILVWILLAILVIGAVSTAIGGEPAPPPPLTEEQLNRLEHCSGYQVAIERVIKRNLKDADSFEWRESSSSGLPTGGSLAVLPAGADGEAPFVGHYRAKNSFGALTLGEAVGYIQRDGCVVHLATAE